MRLLLIGRSAHADVVVADASVGATHAEVVITADGRIHITDRATAGGTYHRVAPDAPWSPLRQAFVEARLNHLTSRMTELSKIDVKDMAYDKVGFGSTVTIHDIDMGEDFTFTITAGDFIDLDAGQVSLASPIGQGLLGAGEGEEVVVRLPAGDRKYKILELSTLPQQLEGKS